MKEHLLPHKDLLKLMLAGNAVLIFLNPKTGGRRQYHIKLNKEYTRYSVKHVHAPGIIGVEYEKYIGSINTSSGEFFCSAGYRTSETEMFRALYQSITSGRLNPEMQVMHTGRCCACNRMLTDPESIELGIGPFCRDK